MWTHCITSISHVLKLNGYGGRQVKGNEKRQSFKWWQTLVIKDIITIEKDKITNLLIIVFVFIFHHHEL